MGHRRDEAHVRGHQHGWGEGVGLGEHREHARDADHKAEEEYQCSGFRVVVIDLFHQHAEGGVGQVGEERVFAAKRGVEAEESKGCCAEQHEQQGDAEELFAGGANELGDDEERDPGDGQRGDKVDLQALQEE